MDLLGNDITLDDIKSVPDDTEFALEAILAEYGGHGPSAVPAPAAEEPSPALPIEADAQPEEDAVTAELSSAEGVDYAAEPPSLAEEEPDEALNNRLSPPSAASEEDYDGEPEEEFELPEIPGPETDAQGVRIYAPAPTVESEAEPDSEAETEDEAESYGESEPFAASAPDEPFFDRPASVPLDPDASRGGYVADAGPEPVDTEIPHKSFGESLAAPLVSIIAFFTMRRKIRASGDAAAPADEQEEDGPELDAESASKYYAGHLKSAKTRLRLAIILSAILLWISFGLPVAGMLKDTRVCALMCLILELSIVMLGLDIFTGGIMSILRGRISIWSLTSIACIAGALDAAVTAALYEKVEGIPFCGAAALAMTFALFGSLQSCRGCRISLRALSLSGNAFAVTAENGVAEDGVTLLKSKRGTSGFLRRCEEPDAIETTYGAIAPFLLIAALLLSLVAAWRSDSWPYFFRIFAALTIPCAPFAAFLAIPLPFSILSRRLFQSGAAIAGWSGLRDIGRSKHLIVTDRDIFPTGTISIDSIRVLEGTWPEKVISYAGSMICASGSCLAPAFTELMRRNNCSIQRIEDFCCHEGGGLTALINGEEILCGNAGFMRLMSVRLPQKMASKSSVFISINGVLSAIFIMKYVPVTSVQDALVSLLHTRRDPIFAVRDFNVTPLMIRQKFRMPTDGFDFPPFSKRYEISAAEPSPDSQISAIISREGLGALVETSDRGRRAYIAAMLAVILSVVCTLVGMALMFMLCMTASFDSATCGNLLTYMFLWLVPVIILAFGLAQMSIVNAKIIEKSFIG